MLYHAVHGLGLLAIGVWRATDRRAVRARLVGAASALWLAGIVCFSGSLYGLSLGGPSWLGPVTPLGGVCFLVGWALLAIAAWRLEAPGSGTV